METHLIACANDWQSKIGLVAFEHIFTKGTCFSILLGPVDTAQSDLAMIETFEERSEVLEAFEELAQELAPYFGEMIVHDVPRELREKLEGGC